MIQTLRLTHFALVDSCEITFDAELNILTGETGAGKTILLEAIYLLMGQKGFTEVVRNGEEKATVEATFAIQELTHTHRFLEESGITFDPEEGLIVKREIYANKKNRVFINGQQTPLHLLVKLGDMLFEVATQSSSQQLRSQEKQRDLLDRFKRIDKKPFTLFYLKLQEVERKLEELEEAKRDMSRKLERIEWELSDLEAIDTKDSEEALFAAYKRKTDQKETFEALGFVLNHLTHPENTIVPALTTCKKKLHALTKNLPRLEEAERLLESTLLQIQEASYLLSSITEEDENNRENLGEIEEKLSRINQVKKKYGLSLSEIPLRIEELKKEQQKLWQLDEAIEAHRKLHHELTEQLDKEAKHISEQRREAAVALEKRINKELPKLNMPNALFSIHFQTKERTWDGEDLVIFALRANFGEKEALLHQKVSGGELSRIFFALKLAFAEKDAVSTLIFDEIDSNIGGETAVAVGEKLRQLSLFRQVICITHFPQVARFAKRHFCISKKQKAGRTETLISALSEAEKRLELLRMVGGENALIHHSSSSSSSSSMKG